MKKFLWILILLGLLGCAGTRGSLEGVFEKASAFEQQGAFEQAGQAYELLARRARGPMQRNLMAQAALCYLKAGSRSHFIAMAEELYDKAPEPRSLTLTREERLLVALAARFQGRPLPVSIEDLPLQVRSLLGS